MPEQQFDLNFDGESYDKAEDQKRLTGQIERVFKAMRDGRWKTLPQIADLTGDPEASVSARLRDLRKKRFGEHKVERQRERGALWHYRLIVNELSLAKFKQ